MVIWSLKDSVQWLNFIQVYQQGENDELANTTIVDGIILRRSNDQEDELLPL